jgi:beta-galactosidase
MKRVYNINLFLFLFFLALMMPKVFAQNKHTFDINDGHFMYDGKPVQIVSGEMHYSRIPHQYWRHRFQMLKAMGLNTVATYVFWNLHEVEPGRWDFSGDKNLKEFIKIASEEGLNVILRLGPYACAEWEFGGYPWWLQNIEGLELRRDNEPFLKYTDLYIKRLYQEVKDLLITNGGPIIMIQVENEFGSYVSQRKDISLDEHRRYNAKIKEQLLKAGFNTTLFTSDGTWLFEGGSIEGVLPTSNGESNVINLKRAVDKYHGGKGPYMVAEFYPGWLSHWAEPFPSLAASNIARIAENYLKNDISFNLYMAHGGTNFGFTNGANYDNKHDIQPDLTSYDYDAPISEAGWVTPKYDSLRSVISKYVKWKLPAVPTPIPVIEIPSIKLSRVADVLSCLEKGSKIESDVPLTFERLNQGYGYVLYSKRFNQPICGTLDVSGLRDYAIVYVNGEKVGELNRYDKKYTMQINIPFNSTLQILVENMGRINYGSEIVNNKKGIISSIKIDNMEIDGNWEMHKLPMDEVPDLDTFSPKDVYLNQALATHGLIGRPLVYEGTFSLDKVGDTFIDMSDWGKGIIFVNGKNLGRYWNVGPQQTLYLPGVWLKKGLNKILIFEQINNHIMTEIKTVKTPVLNQLKKYTE